MTFHFRVNVEDSSQLPLTWQNEVWMDDCVLGADVFNTTIIEILFSSFL